jgi:glycosyltransferase involved in cell wall biosynthesis
VKKSISVLIPCYNAAEYLPDLIGGIMAQTVPFSEIICYDDCSLDNTVEVLERLNIKVIQGNENRGAAFARNRLIDAANSDWIHFHDADDLIDPLFVETAQNYLQDEGTQFLCNTYVFARLDRSKNLGNINYESLNYSKDLIEYFLDNVGFASMGLYSKKALVDIGGFREDIKGNEDPDMHIRLVNKGYKIKCIPKYLVTKLEHSQSFSHQNWMRCLEDKLICYESYLFELDNKYVKTIGKHISWLGAYFYSKKNYRAGKKALALTKKSGVNTISISKFASLFTKVFGIRLYYMLLSIRGNLNQAYSTIK